MAKQLRAAKNRADAFARFVYMNDDGSTRELLPDEAEYLATAFHPADGGRPYIKAAATTRTPDGRLGGFLRRSALEDSRR